MFPPFIWSFLATSSFFFWNTAILAQKSCYRRMAHRRQFIISTRENPSLPSWCDNTYLMSISRSILPNQCPPSHQENHHHHHHLHHHQLGSAHLWKNNHHKSMSQHPYQVPDHSIKIQNTKLEASLDYNILPFTSFRWAILWILESSLTE